MYLVIRPTMIIFIKADLPTSSVSCTSLNLRNSWGGQVPMIFWTDRRLPSVSTTPLCRVWCVRDTSVVLQFYDPCQWRLACTVKSADMILRFFICCKYCLLRSLPRKLRPIAILWWLFTAFCLYGRKQWFGARFRICYNDFNRLISTKPQPSSRWIIQMLGQIFRQKIGVKWIIQVRTKDTVLRIQDPSWCCIIWTAWMNEIWKVQLWQSWTFWEILGVRKGSNEGCSKWIEQQNNRTSEWKQTTWQSCEHSQFSQRRTILVPRSIM